MPSRPTPHNNNVNSQTNSSKPAFVFWALIALPTLTVLIGAIGDAVSSFVNWYTDWVGHHTQNMYHMFLALGKKNTMEEIKRAAKSAALEKKENEAKQGDDGFDKIAHFEMQATLPLHVKIDDLTTLQAKVAEERYRPFMLLKAADHILSNHLDADPPRRYKFDEWSWLLKLLGEDENDESGHRRVGQPVPEGTQVMSPVNSTQKMDGQVWSWLGQESPLMSLDEGKHASRTAVLSDHAVLTACDRF